MLRHTHPETPERPEEAEAALVEGLAAIKLEAPEEAEAAIVEAPAISGHAIFTQFLQTLPPYKRFMLNPQNEQRLRFGARTLSAGLTTDFPGCLDRLNGYIASIDVHKCPSIQHPSLSPSQKKEFDASYAHFLDVYIREEMLEIMLGEPDVPLWDEEKYRAKFLILFDKNDCTRQWIQEKFGNKKVTHNAPKTPHTTSLANMWSYSNFENTLNLFTSFLYVAICELEKMEKSHSSVATEASKPQAPALPGETFASRLREERAVELVTPIRTHSL